MHILDKIVAHKIKEVELQKEKVSIAKLEASPYFTQSKIDLYQRFKNTPGIISEFKRRSPSKPSINLNAKSSDIVPGYENAGATASSILTDEHFFGGSMHDISEIRNQVSLPILRKDFIIDEYQIIESKALGANIILLIGAILTEAQISSFSLLAESLKLSVLYEIHTKGQLDMYNDTIEMVGVNNRDLTNFSVDYNHSISLFPTLPSKAIKISESGISNTQIIQKLQACGYDGFLIGESFMKTSSPAGACKEFIQALKQSKRDN